MAYINFQNCSKQEYEEIIYSGDNRNNTLKILFNGTELENADLCCESLKRKSRIIANDGGKRFSLDNFVATELELILHGVELSTIQDQVEISIGTKVDSNSLGDVYEYVPLGIFNIQDTPTTDKDKITIKLRDNASLFDFKYNAEPLIEENYGSASKMQILQDICNQAGVTCAVSSFNGMNDELSIYDNSISGRVYVSYIAEQAGMIATIDRDGSLIFVDLTQLTTQRIPLSIVEKYEKGDTYKISRVVYEDGIRKYEQPEEEQSDYDNLYINTSNPYISSQGQIDYIYNLLNGFEIDSLKTGKILGNPAIDPYDIIEIYDDLNDTVIARTLANHTFTYRGVMTNEYDTQIGKDTKQENVSLTGEATFQKYARTSIDNLEGNVEIIVGRQDDQQEQINQTIYDINSIQSLFQITGGTNLIKNSQFLLTDEVWDITVQSGGECTELGKGYNANLIGQTTSIANIVMKNATISTKTGNITNIKTNQTYTLGYYYTLDANTEATITLTGTNSGNVIYTKTFNEATSGLERETFQFTAYDTDYTLTITTSTTLSGSFTIYDLMLNSGEEKPWEPAISEVYSTVLKMSQLGLQVYASGSGTITLLTSMGFKVYTSVGGEIGQVVTEFTNTGIKTIDIEASGKIKNGTWVDKDLVISSYTHHFEYMEVN